MTDKLKVLKALDEIEQALTQLNLWSFGKNQPAEQAFLSTTPFFMDTMSFEQWLEFVLIPRFRQMINEGLELPSNVQIHPYAQEIYRGRWVEFKMLIAKLYEFDRLFKS